MAGRGRGRGVGRGWGAPQPQQAAPPYHDRDIIPGMNPPAPTGSSWGPPPGASGRAPRGESSRDSERAYRGESSGDSERAYRGESSSEYRGAYRGETSGDPGRAHHRESSDDYQRAYRGESSGDSRRAYHRESSDDYQKAYRGESSGDSRRAYRGESSRDSGRSYRRESSDDYERAYRGESSGDPRRAYHGESSGDYRKSYRRDSSRDSRGDYRGESSGDYGKSYRRDSSRDSGRAYRAEPSGGSGRDSEAPTRSHDVSSQMHQSNSTSTSTAAHDQGRQHTSDPFQSGGRSETESTVGGSVGRGAMRGRRQIGDQERPRTRPKELATKKGTGGTPVRFMANYFKIMKVPEWALRQYRVDIAPDEDRTALRKYLLRAHKDLLGGYLFDGTVLYTTQPITSRQKPTLTLTSKSKEDKVYTITIKNTGKEGSQVQMGDYAYIQVFNLLVRHCLFALDLQMLGRDYYDPRERAVVREHRLELWPGYKTSIRQHENDVLMCVEITHKVMRLDTVLGILKDCIQKNRHSYQKEFMRQVVGCIVLTKYNNKTYRIDDVNWDLHPDDTFPFKNERMTYVAYMKQKYEMDITDMKQPMLVSRAKARDLRAGLAEVVNLIPEVCYCTGLTDDMRRNMSLMRALAVHTRVSPDNRIKKLLSFNDKLQRNPQAMEKLKEFGMSLDRNLVNFDGRKLEDEEILFGDGRKGRPGPDVDWTRDLRSSPMLLPKELTNWVLLVPYNLKREALSFVECLKRAGAGMRFRVGDPRVLELQRDFAGEYINALNHALDKSQPQLIMCALMHNRGETYSTIKKRCCVDRAVPTQIILAKNLTEPKRAMSVATKVAIQINCKLGGAAWGVSIPVKDLMAIGFDVCHDTNSKSQSYGAMVASLDRAMSRYFSVVTPHTNGEELSNNLALNVVKAVRKYAECNQGQLPANIVIYRDGVGEGQIPYVNTHELESIKRKLTEVYASQNKPLKMTFVIVTKRINTRVFTERGQNPPPASVVDDVITDPEKYDFFLVSQSVREGTVSPTSYNILDDGMHLQPHYMQRLTYKMCHLYFNWSGTVRVPAPCQYAHKLAFLVGQSLHREPHCSLENLLYFL